MLDFLCYTAFLALAAAFILCLMNKWGVLEWLQVHAPSDFLNELFRCKFCCSWWVSVLLAVPLSLIQGQAELLLLPFFTTVITKELW